MRWVRAEKTTWAQFEKAVTDFAHNFSSWVDEYNFAWRTSFAPITVLRFVFINWRALDDSVLVGSLRPQREGMPAAKGGFGAWIRPWRCGRWSSALSRPPSTRT